MPLSLDGVILFSDDVREEVGSKFSLMGVLGPEIWVGGSRELRLMCTFLLWAVEPRATIKAYFEVEGDPLEQQLPAQMEREVAKTPGDTAERWLVQMTGPLRLNVGEKLLVLRAHFEVGDRIFSNQLVIDPKTP